MIDALTGTAGLATILRLGLAALLGGLIGLDREASGKPAGFRTNILICVGAALLTELSIDVADRWVRIHGTVADPGRIAAQIVSGIGFLGAGTILQSRHGVRGLTTAATIWVVAAIGMAVGASAYLLAISSAVGVVLTLAVLGRIELRLEPHTREERWLRVHLRNAAPGAHQEIQNIVRQRDAAIRSLDVERREEGLRVTLRIEARSRDLDGLVDELLGLDSVTRAALE